ncbi:unnamed protein product [Parnassius apollo]|uniref:(apollo) hypothetical protein n=1 Tax=Parnassius apollo TaxID=110799 RepID=A0A8S3X269_PARAO|nr:unnamed protein product [Parnassius apollo]
MSDVFDIIDYIKSLKKGFDNDLFQSKINELAYIVENDGLEYEAFHTLFKVWLNLSIPITKWMSLGSCLVPQERLEPRTVEYSLRWILNYAVNSENEITFSRVGFLLDWLTAALDSDSIDIDELNYGYELFYYMLAYEALTPHVMKLVYNLTKPGDVTRRKVLELLNYAKIREGKKNLYRQLQVLLGLFKSYKPECVPEDVPSISIHASFRKISPTLLNRFKRCQNNRNSSDKIKRHLLWTNPFNFESGRNKKADPLVPNMEFINIGSKQYANQGSQKNYLDFSDKVSLLEYSVHHVTSRPARLRALLCNTSGITLLALASDSEQAFFSHDLHHLLNNCFLDISPHSYAEKRDLLRRLAIFQQRIVQGVPVITRFLAQFLPFWNEKDFFAEIMDLIEWISVDFSEYIASIMESLMKIYYRAQPLEQCAILKSLSAMYCHLVYTSTRKQRYFMSVQSSQTDYPQILRRVASNLNDLYNKGLQINPEEVCVQLSIGVALERCARAELTCARAPACVPRAFPLALPLAVALLAPSSGLLDNLATLIMLYRKISSIRAKDKGQKSSLDIEQLQVIQAYTSDMISCLYNEEFLSGRKDGFIFNRLHPQTVEKLSHIIPDVDSKLSIRNHLAFAPYIYDTLDKEEMENLDTDIILWFSTVINQRFTSLSKFLMTAVPQLRGNF